jgi:hypothetical protein
MILSQEYTLSDDQAITATAASTNYIDRGAAGTPYGGEQALTYDAGAGGRVPFTCMVTTAFTAAGAATLTADLEVDDNTSFSSATTVLTSGAIGKALLVPGYNMFAGLDLPTGITERYWRVNFTVATGPMTAGNIYCGIDGGRRTNNA